MMTLANDRRSRTVCGLMRGALVTVALWMAASDRGVAQSPNNKGEWPQFLGPQRNGLSTETGLLDAWPKDGPKEVWREWHCRLRFAMFSARRMSVRGTGGCFLPDTIRLQLRDWAFLA